jgi:Mg2+ and Co2+ transporter CorA
MNATLLDSKKNVFQISIAELPQRLPADGFFWLDIDGASAEELKTVASALRIDEETSAWLPRFGKRARFEIENQRLRISTWTAEGSGRLCEVHGLYAPSSWLLTVHTGAGPTMERARSIFKVFIERESFDWRIAIFIVLNELLAGFDPLLEHCDEWLDKLEMQILQSPKKTLLQELSVLRQHLLALHRVLVPHRDEIRDFVVSAGGVLADFQAQHLHEYSDRVVGLVEDIDDQRQRVTDAMQGYSASVSNVQARVINRLTIISAVFLPLTFLTGFFGMNFQWMINRIASVEAFLLLGIGLFTAILAFMLGLFWRQGWLGEKSAETSGAAAPTPSGVGASTPGAHENETPSSPPERPA